MVSSLDLSLQMALIVAKWLDSHGISGALDS